MENQDYAPDNASMRSSSVHDELDIVDLYRNKIKSNINVKKKNLKLIFSFLVASFVGLLLLSGCAAFFLRQQPTFLFTPALAAGLRRTQEVISYMFALSFVADVRHLRSTVAPQVVPTVQANRSLGDGPDDAMAETALAGYFNYTVGRLQQFIRDAPSFSTPIPNSVDAFLYSSAHSWQLNSTRLVQGTFLNFLKEALIVYALPAYANYSVTAPDFATLNFPQLIAAMLDLQGSLTDDLDACRAAALTYLYRFLFAWCPNQLLLFPGGQRGHHLVRRPGPLGGQHHLPAPVPHPAGHHPALFRLFQRLYDPVPGARSRRLHQGPGRVRAQGQGRPAPPTQTVTLSETLGCTGRCVR